MAKPSFPSTHVFVFLVIMLTMEKFFPRYATNKKATIFIKVMTYILCVIMTSIRLLSGEHWLTDIIGGILLALTLTSVYELLLSTIKNDKEEAV